MIEKILNGKVAMLAQPTAKMDGMDYSKRVYVQPKLDGVRCIFTKTGAFSRRGNRFLNVTHLEAQLFEFFQDHPNAVLDGELYNHELKNDFEKIISLVRKTVNITPEDRTEASEKVQFHMYDVVMPGNYMDRLVFMDDLLRKYRPHSVVEVTTALVQKEEEVWNIHEFNKEDGYEGSMIRLDGEYENKRSKNLVKVKDIQDSEGVIIDVIEGKGKLTGMVGKFVMQFPNGKTFGAPMSGTKFADRKIAWENRESFIGKEATIEYFEITKNGVPRFPVFKALRNYE